MSNINTGTRNKRLIQEQIINILPQVLPRSIADAADYIAFYTDLTPRCVKENYLNPMIAVGLIEKQGQTLTMNSKTTPDIKQRIKETAPEYYKAKYGEET
jgi:hypothetical protein